MFIGIKEILEISKTANIIHLKHLFQDKLECAASNGNRYPPYPQVMATAISR